MSIFKAILQKERIAGPGRAIISLDKEKAHYLSLAKAYYRAKAHNQG